MSRNYLFAVVAVAVLATGGAHAQASPDSIQQRNDCRLAAQVLQTGHPEPKFQWATAIIHQCGSDAVATANVAAIQRLSSSADADALAQLWNQLQYFRDARVYRAAVSVARDPASSSNARVQALLWLLRLRAPDKFADSAAVTGGFDETGNVRGGCGRFTHLAGVAVWSEGEPLPAGVEMELTGLGAALSLDGSQPLDVRTAARCVQTLGYPAH